MTRKEIYHGRAVDLGVEEIILPNGAPTTLEIVRHPGGAGTVAINDKNEICLVKQYRHAAGDWLWEIPAGRIDPGEEPQRCAERELVEEAGIAADHWNSLGWVWATPGFCDEKLHFYLARDLKSVDTQLEPDECLEVHWIRIDKLRPWLTDGTIRDAKTLIALQRALARH